MKLSAPALMAALIFAAGTALPAREEPRPPKAIPVPEDEPAVQDTPMPDPAAPPKATPVEEDGPPPDSEAPDQPWEDPDTKREREKAAEKQRKADELKAREAEMATEKEEEAKTVKAVPNDPKLPVIPPPREIKNDKPKIPIQRATDPHAKPLSLRVPAPRGLIVDRNGQPLAQNRMAHYIGIQLPMKEGLTDVQILDFARGPLAFCQNQLPGGWDVTDADIIEHYHKRRWVPMFSPSLLADEKAAKLADSLLPGVVLRPFFLRTYPENMLAGHLLGQMGKSGAFPSPKQDLEAEELMWPPTVGRAGLEKRFDRELTGEPGLYNALFDSKGDMLSEEWTERPRAGHTVVTTLDLEMQRIAERNLREHNVRGAFVIMDVRTGDILAMASNPSINPNDWVYGVNDEYYEKQLKDKEFPLMCRAIQNTYPPASTFKIVTAFAALETESITPDTEFGCPPGMYFSNIWMRNHSKTNEGPMDVERAIMRSCNTWFYRVSQICGGNALSDMGRRFGFGEKTGICLEDTEKPGLMPTNEYHKKKDGGSLSGGILANTAIGQGDVLATPLQVCRMMAGVARGDVLPRPRLVKLIQDTEGRVVQHFPISSRPLGLAPENVAAVQRGMRQVVAGDGGTGSRAENDYVPMAGKTGTGQWHPAIGQYVAWFGGFIPYKEPEYAYACLYEGDPGEDEISGGRKVAPIVGDVFNEIYKAKKKHGDIKEEASDDDDDALVTTRPAARRATPVGEARPAAAQPAPPPEPPKRGGLRWLFRRRTPPPVQPAQPKSPFSPGRPLR